MPDPASELDALAEEFYAVWFRYRPDLALTAGAAGGGCLLPAQDDDEIGALAIWLESMLLGLDEIDHRALDPDRRLDYALMAGSVRVEHAELRDLDWRCRDPLRFLPLAEVQRLTLEPVDGLRDWIAQLFAAMPEYLRHGQSQLRGVGKDLAPALVRVAVREAERGRCYLRELVRGPWLRRHCNGIEELESLVEGVCDALSDFREALTGEILPRAEGPLGCGEDHLALRLAGLHFLDADLDVVAEVLDEALGRVRDRIRECEPPPWPVGAEVAETRAGSRWPAYQGICEESRREIETSGLITLPATPLRLVIRLACPGPDPSGAQSGVHYVAQGQGAGTLYVSTPDLESAEVDREFLRDHCLRSGWGGCHLFAFADRARAARMPRRLANAESLIRGWHLYLDRHLSHGAGEGGSRRRAALRRQGEALMLARLDLDLHRGRIDSAAAVARLSELGLEGVAAESRLVQLARAPGDALAGALGWLLLEAARSGWEEGEGAGLAPVHLHDQLVAQGTVPLSLVLAASLGEPGWCAARGRVFGG